MAVAVIMPKQGNSVESCIITTWKKQVGEQVRQGDALCEVETDKAVLEVTSPQAGTLLARFFEAGDDVPVLTNIAVIGDPGEEVESLRDNGMKPSPPASDLNVSSLGGAPEPLPVVITSDQVPISPRARNLAAVKSVPITGITGTGPAGRIIERDIQAVLATRPSLTPAARDLAARSDLPLPDNGSGIGGRITMGDLSSTEIVGTRRPVSTLSEDDETETIPLKGIRKVIADRMRDSLHTTAQLTLNTSADARALQTYRQRLKTSPEAFGLQAISMNDLLLFALSRVLLDFPDVNATLTEATITRYQNVHLGFAVDTPRGLLVPVIRYANRLSLKQLAAESKRLATACINGSITPDELTGGTFTVSNLGTLGIESFTPVLNSPQAAILGVGKIDLKAVEVEGTVQFIPHLHLSLTIDHQVVDGAPGARFLQTVVNALTEIDLLLAT
ncbi:MAG: 2-oxo acid dehydrogenase subunit E2 [Anaerolineae bacterium]|nr:2-oxo acid dehydrogenase subunit E2 [Anaerolineae bacterium]